MEVKGTDEMQGTSISPLIKNHGFKLPKVRKGRNCCNQMQIIGAVGKRRGGQATLQPACGRISSKLQQLPIVHILGKLSLPVILFYLLYLSLF